MELIDSVPISKINSKQSKREFNRIHYNPMFKITDVNLTEFDGNKNQVITWIGQKQSVNVTVSGFITEPFKISDSMAERIFNDSDYINGDTVDIQGNNINLIFHGIRIIRDKVVNENINSIVKVTKLLVDNVSELYGFLKPLYVNKGEMSVKSEKNICLTYEELVELLEGTTVNLGATDVRNNYHTVYHWITEYKKGDTNGN